MTGALKIYSGRNRPDLAPVYRLYEQLTDATVEVEKVYHWAVEGRVVNERADPRADILLTNGQLALQLVQEAGVFESYAAPVAREYAEWLRGPDSSWLSFTAWPRVALINRRVLGDDSTSPLRSPTPRMSTFSPWRATLFLKRGSTRRMAVSVRTWRRIP